MGRNQQLSSKYLFFKVKDQIYIEYRFLDDGHTAWYHLHGKFGGLRQTIPLEVQKTSSWLLFHHALYHSYTHHDADGYATWSQVLEGFKIWVVNRPLNLDSLKSRNDIFKACEPYISEMANDLAFYGSESEKYAIFACPGDIM